MTLRDVIAKDQAKIFGNVRDLGERITYIDGTGVGRDLNAFIERENLEAKEAVGYGPNIGRACLYVWIPKGEPVGIDRVETGVDQVLVLFRQGDAEATRMRVTAVLPDSESYWRVECTK